jgi:hypothetical protein
MMKLFVQGRFCFALVALLISATLCGHPQAPKVPDGFTPIFDGKTLKGWHWSLTVHHGTTGHAAIKDGVMSLSQYPYGQGGLLISDKVYKNFELYLEVKAPYGNNSGIFLRSTEAGSAYQVELLPGTGTSGDLMGENMRVSLTAKATDLPKVWKDDDFNAFRIRVEGDSPHLTLWVNGVQMWDVQEPVNDKIAGETSGHIGLQLHWTDVYEPSAGRGGAGNAKPGQGYSFRNIGIKELP